MSHIIALLAADPEPVLNLSARKVGGIWFIRVGRFCFSFCITRAA